MDHSSFLLQRIQMSSFFSTCFLSTLEFSGVSISTILLLFIPSISFSLSFPLSFFLLLVYSSLSCTWLNSNLNFPGLRIFLFHLLILLDFFPSVSPFFYIAALRNEGRFLIFFPFAFFPENAKQIEARFFKSARYPNCWHEVEWVCHQQTFCGNFFSLKIFTKPSFARCLERLSFLK